MITNGNYKLVYISNGLYVHLNDAVIHNQEPGWQISGGEAPRHAGSTGRVYLANVETGQSRIFFPNVAGCQWIYHEPSEQVDRRKA